MKDRDRNLIIVGIVTFVVGDLITTLLGLSIYPNQIEEKNPVMKNLIVNFGLLAIIPVKLFGYSVIYSIYKILPKPYSKVALYEIIIFGTYATLGNSYLLLTLK